jgi:putative Ca2+/H+ antiporter (TMEM165/GDT1 family)
VEAFLVSTGIVALAEIGDKTQLLAFILAAKFRRPLPIVLGILAATLANVPAVLLGERIAHRMPIRLVHGIAAAIFAVLGALTLTGAGEALGF